MRRGPGWEEVRPSGEMHCSTDENVSFFFLFSTVNKLSE